MKNAHETVFAQRLNEALTELGLSQSELARRIKVTPQAVQRWCNGDSSPRSKALSALAEAIGKPEHWFFLPYGDKPVSASQPGDKMLSASNDARPVFLSADEEKLINTYRDLPGAERKNMLAAFQARLEEVNKFLEEFLSKK